MSRRSRVENSGFLLEFTPIATISLSHRPTACLTTSRWPLVTGSNEPGYSAIRGMSPSTPPRAARQAGLVPALGGDRCCLIFRTPLNPSPGRGVYLGRPAGFRPLGGDET